MDGSIRTADNADYATGFSRVVILLPLGRQQLFPAEKSLDDAVAELNADVTVIVPDEASVTAIGTSPLDPSTRGPAAKAGRAQGQAIGTS